MRILKTSIISICLQKRHIAAEESLKKLLVLNSPHQQTVDFALAVLDSQITELASQIFKVKGGMFHGGGSERENYHRFYGRKNNCTVKRHSCGREDKFIVLRQLP